MGDADHRLRGRQVHAGPRCRDVAPSSPAPAAAAAAARGREPARHGRTGAGRRDADRPPGDARPARRDGRRLALQVRRDLEVLVGGERRAVDRRRRAHGGGGGGVGGRARRLGRPRVHDDHRGCIVHHRRRQLGRFQRVDVRLQAGRRVAAVIAATDRIAAADPAKFRKLLKSHYFSQAFNTGCCFMCFLCVLAFR